MRRERQSVVSEACFSSWPGSLIVFSTISSLFADYKGKENVSRSQKQVRMVEARQKEDYDYRQPT